MIHIDGESLTIEQFQSCVLDGEPCDIADFVRARIHRCREIVDKKVAEGEAIYGINTGFGDLSNVRIDDDKLTQLQERLVLSHCAGVGEPLADEVVRGMLLLRSNTLAKGYSGARECLIKNLLALLNADVLPLIPSRGSVGASGDLAPLAHLALPLTGRGRIRHQGKVLPALEGLQIAGIEPIVLQPKEGLALINGTQAMTSLLALTIIDCRRLLKLADLIAALSTDALRGTDDAFDPRLHLLRRHPGQADSAENLWRLLQQSEIRESHRCGDIRVQDPYSIRCAPQVHGAIRDVLADCENKVLVEMNSVTDNPLVFVERQEILSGGNFHGEPMALAADFLAIAMTELAGISERRIEKLTNTAFSALPPFLVKDAGLNSGFMIAQVTAAALASENKTLAHPASVDSISTSADKEDHVSMGMWAAIKGRYVVDNVKKVLAIELLAAAQGIDLLHPLRTSPRLQQLHAAVRRRVAVWDNDREMAVDIESALALLEELDQQLMELA